MHMVDLKQHFLIADKKKLRNVLPVENSNTKEIRREKSQ